MPENMERNLRQEALKRGLRGQKKDAYIYGTIRKTGWRPSKEQGR